MAKYKGIAYVIQIEKTTGSFINIGGGKNGTLNRSAGTIDVTTRDSAGWKENMIGLKEWSFEHDGLVVANDEGYKALEKAFMNDLEVTLQIQTPSGEKYKGKGVLTDFPLEMPFDDAVSYSFSLTGNGALEILEAE